MPLLKRDRFDMNKWAGDLRAAAARLQVTTRNIGGHVGLSHTTVNHYMNGDIEHLPRVDRFLVLCAVFNLNPTDYFITYPDDVWERKLPGMEE